MIPILEIVKIKFNLFVSNPYLNIHKFSQLCYNKKSYLFTRLTWFSNRVTIESVNQVPSKCQVTMLNCITQTIEKAPLNLGPFSYLEVVAIVTFFGAFVTSKKISTYEPMGCWNPFLRQNEALSASLVMHKKSSKAKAPARGYFPTELRIPAPHRHLKN